MKHHVEETALQTWEYMVLAISENTQEVTDTLNRLGSEGWQVIGIYTNRSQLGTWWYRSIFSPRINDNRIILIRAKP